MTCGYRNCQSRACGSTIRPDGHELAFCVAHEAIARHLPTLRSATCCTSEGCGRPQGSRSPLCKSCRPRYAAWGLDGYPVPQEAPMPTTPEAQEAQTPPPAAPQDAADGGDTSEPRMRLALTVAREYAMPVADALTAIDRAAVEDPPPAPDPFGVTTKRITGDAWEPIHKSAVRNGDRLRHFTPSGTMVAEFVATSDAYIPKDGVLAGMWTYDGVFVPQEPPAVDAVEPSAADDKPSVVVHIAAITEIERDLRARRDAVAARLISAGFEMEYCTLQTTAYRKGDLLVSLPMDDRGLSLSEFERRVVGAEVVVLTAIISALLKDAAEMATAEPPSPEVVADFLLAPKPACTAIDGEPCVCYAREGDCPHMPGNVDYTAGIRDRATAPGTDGESDGEPSAADVEDAYSGRWGQYTVGVDPATGKEHTAAYVVELVRPSDHQTTDGLLSAILGGKPTAPGPTLAEVQAQLERERERADAAQTQLREAVAELAAIAALLDPEDSTAFDANDQPIPLPVRVQVALMPDKPGQSRIEREIAAVLDRYDAPTTLGSVHVGVKGRVLVTARLLRDSTAVSNQMATEITEASALLTTLGANVTSSPRDALLQVLAALLPDVYRRLLESEAADTRAALARLQARVVNPPPPEKLAEYAAKVAEIDAKIAALDAGEVQK